MIKNIEFKSVSNIFQRRLTDDITAFNSSDKVFVSANKLRNIYKMDKDQYAKLLNDNITNAYRKTNKNCINKINKDASMIAKPLSIDDRIEKIQESQTYITVKDHKDNFPHSISCRLIDPSKTDIGKISKAILDKINIQLLSSIKVNQWKNSDSVINWFKNIPENISLELFNKGLQFAKSLYKISDEEISIIMQARKTLLFNDNEPWVKKFGDKDFDVPTDCFDGADVSEIVGTYILSKISNEISKKQVGLYRDDGLGILKNMSGSEMDRTRKNLTKIFQECGLSIVCKINLTSVDFLDVRFDMKLGTYARYRKPSSDPIYIHKHSNHPQNILRDLLKSISKRISDFSSNEEIFNNHISIYQQALKNSGFNNDLIYRQSQHSNSHI